MTDLDRRSRSPFTTAAALLPTTALVILAAFVFSTIDPTRVTSVPSPVPSVSQPAADSAGATQIVLRLSDGTATATLGDTAAAQQFAALLPVQLTLRDPMGQGKSGRLPTTLTVAKAERTLHSEVGGLGGFNWSSQHS